MVRVTKYCGHVFQYIFFSHKALTSTMTVHVNGVPSKRAMHNLGNAHGNPAGALGFIHSVHMPPYGRHLLFLNDQCPAQILVL